MTFQQLNHSIRTIFKIPHSISLKISAKDKPLIYFPSNKKNQFFKAIKDIELGLNSLIRQMETISLKR